MYASEEQIIEGSIPYTRTSSNLYHLEKVNIRYTLYNYFVIIYVTLSSAFNYLFFDFLRQLAV